jgi:hypothetical protein
MTQKPGLEPKPGQAKPKPPMWARLAIFQSLSRYKPGQRPGFQAKPSGLSVWGLFQETTVRPLDSWILVKSSELFTLSLHSNGVALQANTFLDHRLLVELRIPIQIGNFTMLECK